jgi:hypothetical protein
MKIVLLLYRAVNCVYPLLLMTGLVIGLVASLYYLNPIFLAPPGLKFLLSATKNKFNIGEWFV